MEAMAKERVLKTIQEMPDDATANDIVERILFVQELERRLADVRAGNGIPDEEVDERLKQWLG